VEERQRRGEGAFEEGLRSEGLQAREAGSGAIGRAGGAEEGEDARKEGEAALQEGGEFRGKDSDGVELSIRECQRSRDTAL